MAEYYSSFYGDVTEKGYKISYLLIDRKIKHEFIMSDVYIFVLKSVIKSKEISGFEQICSYLENYHYFFDFPEVGNWK